MKRVNLQDLPEEEWSSPQGRYQLWRKSVSLALGGKKDVGEWGGGHPFDVEWARLPVGRSNFPLHFHSAQAEMYVVLSGSGQVHDGSGSVPAVAGDVFYFGPGDAHRLENTGDVDLCYLVIADQPEEDVCEYPETGKRFYKPERVCRLGEKEVEYFEPGE